MDKRYSNRARQPKQTYYFNQKSRMNKTMVMNNVPTAPPPKRSGSGKVRKTPIVNYKTATSKKPKSGRHASRNNKNAVIYTMAPVMTMTYKKNKNKS